MSKPTIGQSHATIQALANNVNWETLDHSMLQKIIENPKEAGKQFTAFLKNGGTVIVGELKIIKIDRTTPFDPVAFIDAGWTIEEQDEQSLDLNEIDLTEVKFETTLDKKEKLVKGEEKLKRLKAMDCIRLDAGIFKTLWDNQHLIPEKCKAQTNGNTTYIFFDGTVLRNPSGRRVVLCLFWSDGEWRWCYIWLDDDWGANNPSAVLASSFLASDAKTS